MSVTTWQLMDFDCDVTTCGLEWCVLSNCSWILLQKTAADLQKPVCQHQLSFLLFVSYYAQIHAVSNSLYNVSESEAIKQHAAARTASTKKLTACSKYKLLICHASRQETRPTPWSIYAIDWMQTRQPARQNGNNFPPLTPRQHYA